MNSWGIYRYPTPTKKVKSISLLRKKLNQFFMENSAEETADRLPTPTRLAIYLGYASSTAMYKDINDRTEPEYSDLLARAVDMIKDALQKRQLEIAESKEDWHGIEAVLQRMDKAQGLDTKKSQNDVNINISIEEKQRIKSTIDDRLGFLNAEFTEIKPKALSESVMKVSQSEGEEP